MSPLLRIEPALARLATRRTQFYAHIGAGLLPKGVKISQRSVAWPEHEIEAVIQARVAGASDEEIRQLVSKLHEARKAAPIMTRIETVGGAK